VCDVASCDAAVLTLLTKAFFRCRASLFVPPLGAKTFFFGLLREFVGSLTGGPFCVVVFASDYAPVALFSSWAVGGTSLSRGLYPSESFEVRSFFFFKKEEAPVGKAFFLCQADSVPLRVSFGTGEVPFFLMWESPFP